MRYVTLFAVLSLAGGDQALAASTLPEPVTLDIRAFAQGTRFHVCPSSGLPTPECQYTEPFSINFTTSLIFSASQFSAGSVEFELGNIWGSGLASGTINYLGADQFEGVNFSYGRTDSSLRMGEGGAHETAGVSTFLVIPTYPGAVPEPATWALMFLGFGVVGASLRSRRTKSTWRTVLWQQTKSRRGDQGLRAIARVH